MKSFKNDSLFYLRSRRFTVPVIITLLIGYAFTLTHPSISIDDLSMNRYLYGELFAQGRMTATFLQRFLGLNSFVAFSLDFLAVLCFFASAVVFCVLFKQVTNNSLHFYSYVFFSCILLSYPLIFEIFIYMGAGLVVAFGYLLVSFSLLLVNDYFNDHKIRHLLLAAFCLIFVSSGYESLDVVFICGIFAIMLLRLIFTDNKQYKKLGKNLIDGLVASIPLVLGVILEYAMSKSIIILLHLKPSSNGQNGIAYLHSSSSKLALIKSTIVEILFRYMLKSVIYLPIAVINIAGIAAIIMLILYGIKRKSITVVLLFLGTIFTLIVLSFIQGTVTPYRACQIFAFFAALMLMLVFQNVMQSKNKQILKKVVGVLACLLVFYQASDLNKWFYVDYLRFQDDVNTVNIIATQLASGYDIKDKPVIFTGHYKVSKNIQSYCFLSTNSRRYRFLQKTLDIIYSGDKIQTKEYKEIRIGDVMGKSYIPWGRAAFHEVNTELLKLFAYEGYDYKQGTQKMFRDAQKAAKTKSGWPQKGSIVDMGDYILVNFGK